jgi:hydrogenase maturation protease
VSKPVIVLGLGNPLMGDDGIGLVALEELRRQYRLGPDVQIEDGGTLGLALLPTVEDAGALLVLDAVRMGGICGEVVELEGLAIPHFLSLKISPHQTGFRETLALASLRGALPEQLAVVGVEVACAEYAAPISPAVAQALPAMVAAAVARIRSWGCTASRR